MNDSSMVQTDIDNSDPLSTDNIQLQLKSLVPNEQHSASQTSLLSLVTLPKNQDTIEFPNVIDLNVGGVHYTTSLSTLRKYEDSMLAVMFSGRYDLVRDQHGHVFIDRDGRYFGNILNYIRCGRIPSESIVLDVLREAEFFCISSLISKLENSSPSVIALRRRESFRRLIPDYEHMKMDIINKSTEKQSSFQESRVVITQVDHTKLKGTIPCYNCSREFVTVNHACAFDGMTVDLQIQQQLKPIQSDIHIDMDKLVAFVVDELVHDGFRVSAERVTCRFSVRCQTCTVSGLYTAGGILAPRECQTLLMLSNFSDDERLRDHIDQFVNSLTENLPQIHYQAFDFSNIKDSRTELTKLNYDKSKVSFLNLEMIADMFQVFAAVHSAVEQPSSREFSVEVPLRLASTRSIGDALRTFGGYGKPYMIVVCIGNRRESEEFFEKVSQIDQVKKLSNEQMQECMKKNEENIRKYYFGTINNEEIIHRNPIGEIVTQMIASKNL